MSKLYIHNFKCKVSSVSGELQGQDLIT